MPEGVGKSHEIGAYPPLHGRDQTRPALVASRMRMTAAILAFASVVAVRFVSLLGLVTIATGRKIYSAL